MTTANIKYGLQLLWKKSDVLCFSEEVVLKYLAGEHTKEGLGNKGNGKKSVEILNYLL